MDARFTDVGVHVDLTTHKLAQFYEYIDEYPAVAEKVTSFKFEYLGDICMA
jgi:hypothetical protein